jgi:hypothetical protein
MLTHDERADLRSLRDDTVDEEDKKLLRKAISHIEELESKLHTARTLLKTALNEMKP